MRGLGEGTSMKYLVTVYAYSDEIDPLPYEEWAHNDRDLNRIVNRITPHDRPGRTHRHRPRKRGPQTREGDGMSLANAYMMIVLWGGIGYCLARIVWR